MHNLGNNLVICERASAFPSRQVPEADGGIMAAGNHLRIRTLAHHRGNSVPMATEAEDLGLRSHVPNL
jgi:hypothetical protein